jgi:peptidyl-prolyl cis-trans isomerase B (cyclophilin B)
LGADTPGQPPGLSPGFSTNAAGRPSTALGQTPARPNWVPSGLPGQATPVVAQKDPLAVIDTTKGTIVVRLFRKLTPNTVAHFMYICQSGFYSGLTFHRVMPGVLVQGGCPHGNGSGYFVDPSTQQPKFVMPESNPNLKHNAAGVVGIARAGKSALSASSQFYITLSPQPRMDGASSIFGGVVSGMDVVNQIQPGDQILRISVQEQP